MRDSDDATTLGRERPRQTPSRGGLTMRVVGDGVFVTHPLPLSGTVVLGRAAEADVRVDDPSISRRHAALHVGPPLRIEDLGSANGTRIGERVLREGESVEIAVGDVVDLGSVMVIVQAGAPAARPRRVWSHGYFEGRLEDECARSELSGATFAVIHLHVEKVPAETVVDEIAGLLEPLDMIAAYGPSEYELLLVGTDPPSAQRRLDQLRAALDAKGGATKIGVACWPRDGRHPEELVARANHDLHGTPTAPPGLPAEDGTMGKLHRLAERIAKGSISVLLLGETGVGKEVMAESIHRLSPRAKKPFLKLNCAALSETLLESELFGHEKGAFTGAVQAKPGLLETAEGGTVFLDEVGELPAALQAKLLRVLEDRQVLRVGSLKARPIDVRFVAATNRDLEAEVARGAFRQDLYYRLNGISLVIPPLRERPGEVEGLVRSFVAQAARHAGHERPPRVTPEAMALLRAYAWPGNIRELRNVMERAVLLADDDITPEHLPREKMTETVAARAPETPAAPDAPLKDQIEAIEKQRILDALERFAGNQTRAAKSLGISRGTLLARMEAYGLPRPRKK